MVDVKLLKSPTGKYLLAGNADQVIKVTKEMADTLVKDGYAELVKKPKSTRKKEE